METLKHQIKMEIRRVLADYPFLASKDEELATNIMEIVKARKPKRQAGANFYPLAQSIALVCRMDFLRNQGRLLSEAKQLNVDPAELEMYYGRDKWWYKEDWRGKLGQAPTPSLIRETWGMWPQESEVDMSRFGMTPSGKLVELK